MLNTILAYTTHLPVVQYLTIPIGKAGEALENFNKIEDARAADIKKQLSAWKDEGSRYIE